MPALSLPFLLWSLMTARILPGGGEVVPPSSGGSVLDPGWPGASVAKRFGEWIAVVAGLPEDRIFRELPCDAARVSGCDLAGAEPLGVGASGAPGAVLGPGSGLVEDASSGAGLARVEGDIVL